MGSNYSTERDVVIAPRKLFGGAWSVMQYFSNKIKGLRAVFRREIMPVQKSCLYLLDLVAAGQCQD